jgi:hypothetical protein
MVGNCDIRVKQNFLSIFKMKWDKILLSPKEKDQKTLCYMPWNFVQVLDEIWPSFIHFSFMVYTKVSKIQPIFDEFSKSL